MMHQFEAELIQIIQNTPWFMQALRVVRCLQIPHGGIGGGAIRTIVWDRLHGYEQATALRDVDVVYFDPSDVSRERDQSLEQLLAQRHPVLPWDVKNQAGVHMWFERHFGYPVEPVTSLEEAVATWPETATAVAVRLLASEDLQIIALLGLGDLFEMMVRRNPRRASLEIYRKRLGEKRYTEKWPRVRVVPE